LLHVSTRSIILVSLIVDKKKIIVVSIEYAGVGVFSTSDRVCLGKRDIGV